MKEPLKAAWAKHTTGPWSVFAETDEFPGIEAPGLSVVIVGFKGEDCGVRGHHREEILANARLIAAAPDLLEALTYVVDMTYCGADAEWHFKPGYDAQRVVDVLLQASEGCGSSK